MPSRLRILLGYVVKKNMLLSAGIIFWDIWDISTPWGLFVYYIKFDKVVL
jgi:hypothetical protein